ncbi:hypothetical protein AZE42_09480, partial [Rhizopogon vesiculosus]
MSRSTCRPEDILYRTRNSDSDIVIADFGITKHLHSPEEYHGALIMLSRGSQQDRARGSSGKFVDRRPTVQLAMNTHVTDIHPPSTSDGSNSGRQCTKRLPSTTSHLVSEITSIARKKWRSSIILARVINRFGRRLSNASSSGSGGWGEDHMNGEMAEDDADSEDAGDGETNDRSNQIKASLSLGGINSGLNENVKVIGPDEKEISW